MLCFEFCAQAPRVVQSPGATRGIYSGQRSCRSRRSSGPNLEAEGREVERLTSQLCDSKPITKLLLMQPASFRQRVRVLKTLWRRRKGRVKSARSATTGEVRRVATGEICTKTRKTGVSILSQVQETRAISNRDSV